MNLRDWLDVALGIFVVIYIPKTLIEYRRGIRGLLSTAGWLMYMVGMVVEKGLPRVMPELTWGEWLGSTLTIAGLLTMMVSWLVSRPRSRPNPT
jgi:hypothetical protein